MIRLKDVEMEYDNGTKAIKGITLTIEDGEFVFLVGPSGSGKSTIIKLLTGEVEPCAGRIMINGFSVSNISEKQIPLMRRTLGVIFQDFRLIEKKTVYDNLAFVMRHDRFMRIVRFYRYIHWEYGRGRCFPDSNDTMLCYICILVRRIFFGGQKI